MGALISRRGFCAGLTGISATALGGCGSRQPSQARAPAYYTAPAPPGTPSWRPEVAGLDAVIDISHNVAVSDFRAVRRAKPGHNRATARG